MLLNSKNGTLRFNPLLAEDDGEYLCVAGNNVGVDLERIITLSVLGKQLLLLINKILVKSCVNIFSYSYLREFEFIFSISILYLFYILTNYAYYTTYRKKMYFYL